MHTLIYPFTGPATNNRLENGLCHLRVMECSNIHIMSSQIIALLFMQMSIYSLLTSITNEFQVRSEDFNSKVYYKESKYSDEYWLKQLDKFPPGSLSKTHQQGEILKWGLMHYQETDIINWRCLEFILVKVFWWLQDTIRINWTNFPRFSF